MRLDNPLADPLSSYPETQHIVFDRRVEHEPMGPHYRPASGAENARAFPLDTFVEEQPGSLFGLADRTAFRFTDLKPGNPGLPAAT